MEQEAKTPEQCISACAAALNAAQVPFTLLTHPAASTMELCRGIGEELGARHCKNLFLTNKRCDRFILLLMQPEKPYRTSEVSRRLGSTRLSFAGEDKLYEVLGLAGGSVSVMGLINPSAKRAYEAGALRVAVDRDLLKNELICVHPNTNLATFVLKTTDLLAFIRSLGFEIETTEV